MKGDESDILSPDQQLIYKSCGITGMTGHKALQKKKKNGTLSDHCSLVSLPWRINAASFATQTHSNYGANNFSS